MISPQFLLAVESQNLESIFHKLHFRNSRCSTYWTISIPNGSKWLMGYVNNRCYYRSKGNWSIPKELCPSILFCKIGKHVGLIFKPYCQERVANSWSGCVIQFSLLFSGQIIEIILNKINFTIYFQVKSEK